jgi:hypothetical protein
MFRLGLSVGYRNGLPHSTSSGERTCAGLRYADFGGLAVQSLGAWKIGEVDAGHA